MKSKAEHLLRLSSTDEVWADDSRPKKGKKRPLPAPGSYIVTTIIFGFIALAAVVLVFAWGWQIMHQLSAPIGDNAREAASQSAELIAHANRWGIFMGCAALGGSFLLILASILGAKSFQHRWMTLHQAVKQDTDLRVHHLLSELADAKVSKEESRKAQSDAETRLANLMKTHAALEKEIEQRRQIEKNLAQQTQQLERSKDVLEMHVQARTVELQKLQRRNELILNSAGDGICGFDLQGRATFVNPSAAKLTGWKTEDLLGKTEEAIFFPPKVRGEDVPGLLVDQHGNFLPEQTFYRKDGSSFPVEYVRSPIKENEKVVGTVIMFKDITERRLAEDKLNHKADELARSNRELEQFAFVASHDLQEPLRKIQAFGDRLKAKCETVQLEDGRDYLERMQSAAARMQNLINDLLTFSRVLSSSQPFVPVDLGAITKDVLGDLEMRIERTKAKIQVGDMPTIEADATQMRQLLQNLIGNALKFQAAGNTPVINIEGKLIRRDEVSEQMKLPVNPMAAPDDIFCLLTVQDNGIGFEEQYLEKVFAVFQRLHGRSEYEGTGVGLAVCRRIAERHRGYITAQSKPGQGSTFIALLPLTQPPPEEQSE